MKMNVDCGRYGFVNSSVYGQKHCFQTEFFCLQNTIPVSNSSRKFGCAKMAYRDDDRSVSTYYHENPQSIGSKCPFHSNGHSQIDFSVRPENLRDNSEENLKGFIKTRGSLIPGQQFVFWWVGDIYAMVDEQQSKHLFSFEGYNIGRMIRVDNGWRLLTREVGLYKDPITGKILDGKWTNPYTDEQNEVVHVWNDPVNQQFLQKSPSGREFKVPTTLCDQDVLWNAEVFLNYPSPLPRSEFPEKSSSDLYQSAELFQFYTKKSDLLDASMPSAPCLISWVRVGQWLPWMEMGNREGKLVYHCRGKKLEKGFEDISDEVKLYLHKTGKEIFAEAPEDFARPNETSWTYFKKLLQQKGMPRADGTVAIESESDGKSLSYSDRKNVSKTESVALTEKTMTREELSQFDGSDVNKALLLSIKGRVYDVSSARKHYRKGETYNCLTGRDSTWAFVSGKLDLQDYSEITSLESIRDNSAAIESLSESQADDLNHWVEFFDSQYPFIATLEDF
uniref:Cytochrome b5 heme-binding domain-containing protein n=1 Tax=Timspurckia oligopyrenoides TaxID=708627 RepID=A0A7S0ZDH5_9RHOD|mmetsp:Transcript_13523/g.24240  ORF Transcript_13523/g.24240 Transcript_13523/m.24240 type:complete len:506 (+) Transcript_13523:253-1770(+)